MWSARQRAHGGAAAKFITRTLTDMKHKKARIYKGCAVAK